MEKLNLKQLAEKCKNNRQVINTLKNAAVQAQLYELGAHLRQMEKDLFIEGENEAIELATKMKNILGICDLSVDLRTGYKIHRIFESLNNRELPFDVVEQQNINSDTNKYFGI